MNILDFLGPRVPLLPPPQPVVEDVMISGDIFKTIHVLKKSGLGIKTIARRLDLDPGTVRKYLTQTDIQPYSRDCPAKNSLTEFEEWLRARAPEVMFNGKVLFREAREQGFSGSYSIIKRFLKPIREQERVATEATIRFETPPGLQGQVDWGSSTIWLGENRRRVHFFVLVLGFSRRMFVRAYLNEKRHNVIDGHQRAFAWYGGYPKELLYDNARTMVMTERPPAERLNKVFEDFARHHGFEVRFCRPYRPRTKGKVESGVKYVKRNFLAGRRFRDLDDLNASLEQWMREEADMRIHGTTHVTPMSRWAEESAALIPLSVVRPWQPDLEHIRRVANDSRITIETNRYPVAPSAIGKTVSVHVEAGKIEIRNEAGEAVGSHEQLHGRYQEAPMPKEFRALLVEVAKKAECSDLPRHDPRWPEDDVQVRSLSVYDEVAGIKEVA